MLTTFYPRSDELKHLRILGYYSSKTWIAVQWKGEIIHQTAHKVNTTEINN